VATIETLTLAAGAGSYTLGTNAQAAGIVTVTAAGAGGDVNTTINAGSYTSAISITVTAQGASENFFVYGGAGNDTINLNAGTVAANDNTEGADFIQGGAGADTITLASASASGSDTLRINLGSDVASGTTVTAADTVTNFRVAVGAANASDDKIEFVGGTLQSGGGGLNPLSTTIDNFNTTGDVYLATTAELGAFNTGGVGSAYVITVAQATSAITSGFNTQAGINAAVTYLTGNGIAATTTANTNVILALEDNGGRTALFQYSEGALDAGIQSTELTLIGVYSGVTAASLDLDNFL
jgi:hypothetical protein